MTVFGQCIACQHSWLQRKFQTRASGRRSERRFRFHRADDDHRRVVVPPAGAGNHHGRSPTHHRRYVDSGRRKQSDSRARRHHVLLSVASDRGQHNLAEVAMVATFVVPGLAGLASVMTVAGWQQVAQHDHLRQQPAVAHAAHKRTRNLSRPRNIATAGCLPGV